MADDGDRVIPISRGRRKAGGTRTSAKAKANGKYLSVLRELEDGVLTNGIVAYDTFSRTPMLMRPVALPDHRIEEGFVPRALTDADTVELVMHLEANGFTKISPM